MRILFVNPYYKPYLGGIERVIEKLAREFINEGHEVAILTSFAKFPGEEMTGLPAEEIIDGVLVYRRRFHPAKIPFLSASPGAGFRGDVESVIKNFRPDAIQLMSDRWWPINHQVWKKKGGAKVFYSLSFHDLNLSFPAKIVKIPILRVNHLLTNKVDKTVVITEIEKTKVIKTYGTKADNIAVIPWGVDLPQTIEKKPDRVVRILSVGRISKHKGQDKLVEAYLAAKSKFAHRTVLLLAGADEDLWPSLEEKTRQLGLQDEITWLGEIQDNKLVELYRTADIFALTPAYEAFGLVFLEAASYGLPIVTWDVGALQEVLGDSAMITPAGETDKIAESLVTLVNDVESREVWSKKALDLAKKYSWKETAKKFLELYKS